MVMSNSSSSSMTSSTISRESAPMSSINEVLRVTCSLLTPRFSQTISITRSSTEGTGLSSLSGQPGIMGRMYRFRQDSERPSLFPFRRGHSYRASYDQFALADLQLLCRGLIQRTERHPMRLGCGAILPFAPVKSLVEQASL